MSKHKKLNVLKLKKSCRFNLLALGSDFARGDLVLSKIELRFNKEAVIEECISVVDYSSECISLSVKGGIVSFVGEGLTLHSFEELVAVIRGKIKSIDFEA